ncbi:MAG: hypothetical protein AAF183_07935 [Pseudomonadota bacterium]
MGDDHSVGHVHQSEHDSLIKDCGFDRFETSVLEISRRLFSSFADPLSHGWMHAFERAEEIFPPPFGSTIALALVRCIRILRTSRTTRFSFINADCRSCSRWVTQEERHFISILRAARHSRRSEAVTFATMVCEGQEPGQLVDGFERMCVIIGEGPLR